VNRLLGTELPEDLQRELLARVGIDTEPTGLPVEITVSAGPKPHTITTRDESLVAVVPTWRRDIAIEADVAEEVARVRATRRSRRSCPTRRCRRSATRRSRFATRSARRSPGPA
jgi:phenylalanyl-tRNA synthetase beta subunit